MANELHALETEVTGLIRNLSAFEMQLTPSATPEKWSIQQVVEHLLMTYQSTEPVIATRLEKRSPTLARPTLQQRVGQYVLLNLGRFPHGRIAPAAVNPTRPATLVTGSEAAEKVHVELRKMGGLLDEGEALFGSKRAASHMILGPLSMQQWRQFHLVHGRHHLKQIAGILKDRGV